MSDYEKELDSSFIADKKYVIDITDYTARKLKKLGFNVYEFFQDDATLTAFYDRSEIFSESLLLLCEPDDEEAFLKSLNGNVLESARKAVESAIVNFSPVKTRASVAQNFLDMAKIMKMAMEEELEPQKQ